MDVRNKDGIWINSQLFKEEALHFKKYGYYCAEAVGSPGFFKYWDEQERRCIEGYSVGGAHITGHHYFYLNFAPIMLTENSNDDTRVRQKTAVKKKLSQPDFWDGDYNYFWALELSRKGILDTCIDYKIITEDRADTIYQLPNEERAKEYIKLFDSFRLDYKVDPTYLNGGMNLVVGKARRKGYSFKNAAICVNIFNTQPNSLTIIGAFDKKYLYPRGTMGMASSYIDYINKHTAWAKAKDFVDRQDHRRASYKEIENGVAIESGYLSEIQALTFKDNPDAARGKDAALILFEEAGKFPNLIDSFRATEDSMSDGIYQSGQMVMFGTGGDMERGTVDFAKMFYNPLEYNCMPFVNIWDDNADRTFCSFFHPDCMNLVGHYDKQGNSDKEGAAQYEEDYRQKLIKDSSSSLSLQKRVQEHPQKPKEAFLTVSVNNLPVVELQERYNLVMREKLHIKKGTAGYMVRDENGKVRFEPDLSGKLEPLWDYEPKTHNLKGCIIVYESPIPNRTYFGGYDPYRENVAITSTSLGAAFIYKPSKVGDFTGDMIVAEYVGRPETDDDYHRQLVMLQQWYNNTKIMHENEVVGVRSYYLKHKFLHLLAEQPDAVIAKSIAKSKVSRVYGCHMNQKLKIDGIKYLKNWLLTERDVDDQGTKRINIDYIISPALLQEMIYFSMDGNFDRIMAILQLMFQIELNNIVDNENHNEKVVKSEKDLKNLLSSMFKR